MGYAQSQVRPGKGGRRGNENMDREADDQNQDQVGSDQSRLRTTTAGEESSSTVATCKVARAMSGASRRVATSTTSSGPCLIYRRNNGSEKQEQKTAGSLLPQSWLANGEVV